MLGVRLMRGGTSKGAFVQRLELERVAAETRTSVDQVLQRLMGGNDPSGMQLDGLGGGISSTSKVAVMDERQDGVVGYTFAQVGVKSDLVDWKANCGNLAAAAGLYAKELGLGKELPSSFSSYHCVKPVWQANHKYMMNVHVPNAPVPQQDWTCIAGVPGMAPPILVEVVRPPDEPQEPLFPSGNLVDFLHLRDGTEIQATLLQATNPTVFILASSLGLQGSELPREIAYVEQILPEVEHLMHQAGDKMGIPVSSAMRVCWVQEPRDYSATDGKSVSARTYNLQSRITTEGRVHHAHTGTGALNLGIAASIPGTVPFSKVRHTLGQRENWLTIGHPAGTMEVYAKVHKDDSQWRLESVGLIRTARTLMEGTAFL